MHGFKNILQQKKRLSIPFAVNFLSILIFLHMQSMQVLETGKSRIEILVCPYELCDLGQDP